jgi:hypothetical protein
MKLIKGALCPALVKNPFCEREHFDEQPLLKTKGARGHHPLNEEIDDIPDCQSVWRS